MPQSIFLFKRTATQMPADRFGKLAAALRLKGEAAKTDEALFLRDDTRALAYAQPCAKFAGLLFYADQSTAWGEPAEKLVTEERARTWAGELLKKFSLLPKQDNGENIRLEVELAGVQAPAVTFDGKERKPVKVKTDVISKIALNGIPVVGPRGTVRMIFKGDDRPVMMHVGLWESLAVFEERELVREHDAVRTVHERLTRRDDCASRPYKVNDVRLVYFAGEFSGGPDLLTPEYHVEVELRDPRAKGKESIQGPRRVIRLPAYR